jgi:plastocyanin
MIVSWSRKPIGAGLGLSATLLVALALAGCGGKGEETSDAVVLPEPNASVATTPAPAPAGGAPAAPTAPAGTSTAGASAPAAPVTASGWGTLKGQVVFGGTPPAPKDLVEKGKAIKNPEVCAKDAPIPSERLVVDAATKGVKNVLVYIPKPTAVNEEAKSAAAQVNVEFDQKYCIFKPHVLAVMAGASVLLKNSDPIPHNTNSKLRNNTFNPLMAEGQSIPYKVTAERSPGPVECNIHPWMKAYWMVLDNPYSAVTDDKGNFEIKNAPAGTQKVVVWQEATTFVTPPSGEAINIKPNDTTEHQFTIDPGRVHPE